MKLIPNYRHECGIATWVEVEAEEGQRPVAVVVEVAGLPMNRHWRFVPEVHWEARNDEIAVSALQYRVGVVYL
jgi:hypothetical protein